MEQNLGDVVLGRLQGEVARDRNTLVSMVALTQARGGSVKAKRPRVSNPMEGEKPRRFLLNPSCIRHDHRLAGGEGTHRSYPQKEGEPQE